jgi:phage gpG-like protein
MAKKYIHLKFAVEGDVQLSRVFENVDKTLDDISPLLRDLSDNFYAHMEEVFAREGAIGPRQKWIELSPAYKKWKEMRYPGRKILHLTGTLEKSLTQKGAPKAFLQISKMEMKIGTSVDYAMKHQLGERTALGYLPQRKIIELTPDVKKEWTRMMHEWMHNRLTKAIEENRGGNK